MNHLPKIGLGVVLTTFLSAITALAQPSTDTVILSVQSPPEVRISIESATPTNSWSFRNAYAGSIGLADRVHDFQASGRGETVSVRTLAAGEFRSNTPAQKVTYVINIAPRTILDVPHISWLVSDHGILMLADLLPDSGVSRALKVRFELPPDWRVYSSFGSGDSFSVNEAEKAVFLTGRDLRLNSKSKNGAELRLLSRGDWKFSDKDVLEDSMQLLRRYRGLTGFALRDTATLIVAPLPILSANTNWKAETRGSTTVLLLNPNAPWARWRAQLAIICTHELFHLWVPNSLSLNGDYDWFFEGFTSYIALRQALSLKLIPFQEYLNTLARVYDSYLAAPQDRSLLEASERRWTSHNSTVYDKGMLLAFIYDLLVRLESSGASSLDDRYRALFSNFADKPADANEVIIQLLTSSPATSDFAKSYIETRKRVELEKILPEFGIEVETSGSRSEIHIAKELKDDQKKLLRSLGYRK